MATSTVRSALLGWPDLACARCGELRHRRALGGVKGVETMMVARRDMLWMAGQRARAQQSVWRRAERTYCMPACSDERGHRVNYDMRPT